MTALIIIGAILLVIALILFLPVHVTAVIRDDAAVFLRILFIKIKLFPMKEKPEKKEKRKSKKAQRRKNPKRRKKKGEGKAEYSGAYPFRCGCAFRFSQTVFKAR